MIKTEKAHLEINAVSHPGMTGKLNEDRLQVTSFLLGPKKRLPSVLAVLCDGIGGHRAGEVAAQLGVSIITENIARSDAKHPLAALREAIDHANEVIYQASQSDQGRDGMGATCAVAWIIGDRLYTANLGDSRIYLLREGKIIQLTTDHTWVQEAFDAGLINHLEMVDHPNSHVIRRYLGSKGPPKTDFRMWIFEGEDDTEALNNQGMRLKTGDILLLSSDGLTDLVDDREILELITNNTLEDASDKLIHTANARGGHDNITVILMRAPAKGVFRKTRKRRVYLGCLFVLILFSAILTMLFFYWRNWRDDLTAINSVKTTETVGLPTNIETIQSTATPSLTAETQLIATATTFDQTQQPSITPWPTNTSSP